jgi:hypothetical protein
VRRRIRSSALSPWSLQSAGLEGQLVKQGLVTLFGTDEQVVGQTTTSAHYVSLGAHFFRDGLEWKKLELAAGVYSWGPATIGRNVEQWVQKLADDPARVGMIHTNYGNPDVYGVDAPDFGPFTATGLTHFANYVTEMVSVFKTYGLHDYEVGNEQNTTGYWEGTIPEYITMAETFYDAAKAEDPDAFIWLGSIIQPNSSNTSDTQPYSAQQWITTLMNHDWSSRPDVGISYHPYEDAGDTIVQRTPELRFSDLKTLTTKLATSGRSWKIAQTEGGYYTDTGTFDLTQAVAAEYFSRYLCYLRCIPGMKYAGQWMHITDPDYRDYGWWTSSNVAKTVTTVVPDIWEHLNVATTGRLYLHSNGTTRITAHATPNGNVYMIMDPGGGVSVDLTVISSGAATLSVKTAGSTTATSALTSGIQTVSVTAEKTTKILTSSLTGVNDFRIAGLG